MSNATTSAIRLTRTLEVERVLRVTRKRYPAMNDPELFKLAWSRLVYVPEAGSESAAEIEVLASQAVGLDYLSDPEEDIYHLGVGKKVSI